MVLKINTYIYISSNTDENTLSNHISIPKVEEYVSKHGLLRTDYLHKCFKTNFLYHDCIDKIHLIYYLCYSLLS